MNLKEITAQFFATANPLVGSQDNHFAVSRFQGISYPKESAGNWTLQLPMRAFLVGIGIYGLRLRSLQRDGVRVHGRQVNRECTSAAARAGYRKAPIHCFHDAFCER